MAFRRVFQNINARLIRGDVILELLRQIYYARDVKQLVIVSPWITPWTEAPSFSCLLELVRVRKTRILVVTREPINEAHLKAVRLLATLKTAEILFNDSVHAKIVACLAPSPWAFGALGSANLTANSLSQVEVGLMVSSRDGGEALIRELASMGTDYLRTHIASRLYREES